MFGVGSAALLLISACAGGPVPTDLPPPTRGERGEPIEPRPRRRVNAPLPPVVAARQVVSVVTPLPVLPARGASAEAASAPGAAEGTGDRHPSGDGVAVSRSGGDVYRVGDRTITTADVGDFVLRYFPDRAGDAVTQLIDEALIEQEARREGVRLTAGAVARRTDLYMAERTRDVRVQYGADADLETIIRKKHGRSLPAYRADAERLARLTLLRDRLVRLDQLREDGVEVRVLVLPQKADADDAVLRMRAGADMTRIAERLRVRPPSAPAPFLREEIQPPDLAETLVTAPDGAVLAPMSFSGELEGEPHVWWQVFKVVRAWRGSDAPWGDLGEEIEDRLRSGGSVTVQEYTRWRARVSERLGVSAVEPR